METNLNEQGRDCTQEDNAVVKRSILFEVEVEYHIASISGVFVFIALAVSVCIDGGPKVLLKNDSLMPYYQPKVTLISICKQQVTFISYVRHTSKSKLVLVGHNPKPIN